ncbi:proline-rich exported protein (plasmid) [Paraburkholderia sp. PGU19]|uniref:DUF6600 domain-containing protein n=1 Tax=Paraburkholderia sp. PGU19 TaxID=2735434 RepID=UPI0015DA7F60|nr:DUF6600 domain-containing protein [Paraburkholderia sp. PGU19]BCG03467.1 proline-rich exported protein [Paraburkholderia sp. PGU19]
MTTTFKRLRAKAIVAAVAVALVPLSSLAQVPSPSAPAQSGGDPPGRVARLNYFAGTVTMEPAGASDWSYVVLNRPLTTGDQLWADSNARAELHAGSTALRLDQQTAFDIVDLDDDTTQLKVTQGTLSARVRALTSGQSVELDTPNVALVAGGAGLYRVDVAPDGSETTVTVREGSATLYGDGVSYQMSAGEQIRFIGTGLQQQAGGPAPSPDAFDQWVASRNRAEDNSISARYVSREMPGYEDLDANGTWRNDPTYGEVWVPTVAVTAGWAPYHAGHWAWIAPWGWTWVDDAPWGFAPFHYGRWAYVDHAWAWVPGPVVIARPPVYAPALVAFVGGGGGGAHWGIDLAIGGAVSAGVAWFALGPGEAWHPAYHASPAYYSRVNNVNVNVTNIHNTTIITNVTNVTNVHNTYINQTVPGAVAAVPANAFVRGEPVAQALRPVSAQQIAHAQIGAGAPAVAPVRESFAGGMRPAQAGAPVALAQRQVVATRAPRVPAAYHDVLAQRFASDGGRVTGAGEPVIRTTAPVSFAPAAHVAGKPGEPASFGNVHLISRAQAKPLPAHGEEPQHTVAAAPGAEEVQPQQAHAPQAHENAAPHPQGVETAQQHEHEAHQEVRPEPNRPQAGEAMRPEEAPREVQHHAPAAPHAPEAEQHANPPMPRHEEQQHAEVHAQAQPEQHVPPRPQAHEQPREQAHPQPEHRKPEEEHHAE